MKPLVSLFVFFLISIVAFGQNEKPKEDFKLLDNITVQDSVYSVYVKSESLKFTLKVCNVDTCAVTQEYVKSTTPLILANSVLMRIKSKLDASVDPITISDADKSKLGKQLRDHLKASDLATLKASKSDIENSLFSIENEKDQYSAKLILNKTVPYCIKYSDATQEDMDQAIEAMEDISKENLLDVYSTDDLKKMSDYKAYLNDTSNKNKKCLKGEGTLNIIDAKIQFFNNKASSIYFKAELVHDDTKEKLIVLNSRFSVPLRFFNNYGSTVSVQTKNRDDIIIDYNDVFDYESDEFFNYSIANSQVTLSNVIDGKSSSKVVQRRFFDFFTGIIYSDVMGFNSENSNSLLNAQAKLLLPLNLKNKGKWSFVRQFLTTANIALDNSFQDETRFIDIKDAERFSNFDLLKKNNLYGKFSLDFITHEAKGWFTHISLGYNAAFYRTGFRYTETQPDVADTVTERQLLSVGHGPYLNFEIRPQTNFGADVTFSIEDLNYSDTAMLGSRSFDNDLIELSGKDHLIMPYNLINIEANFYWLTNPEKSKGGIYAKIGSYFHTESDSVFPQIMVGYATNLTSFVNRFKPKKEVKK